MTKEKKAQFTIRDVPQTTIDLFNDEKSKHPKIVNPELLTMMIQSFCKPDEKGNQQQIEIKSLQERIKQLEGERVAMWESRDKISEAVTKFEIEMEVERHDPDPKLEQKIHGIVNAYLMMIDKIEAFGEKHPHIPAETMEQSFEYLEKIFDENKLYQDKIKNSVQLTDQQFVCTLNPTVAVNARKCRAVLVKQKLVAETDPEKEPFKYPSELANLAIHNFLHEHFEQILEK